MKRIYLACAAVLLVSVDAASATAQSNEAQAIGLAVAGYIKSEATSNSYYKEKRVLLNTDPYRKVFDGKVKDDARPAVSRGPQANEALARGMGGVVARGEELPRCEEQAGSPPKNCSTAPVVAAQFGEPTITGDSAVVVFRLSVVIGDTRRALWNNPLVAVLRKEAGSWKVIDVKGRKYPM